MARSRVSAGLLLYRLGPGGGLEVLIAFPGGPIFARRDEGYWTVPKGEYEPEEEPLSAACREFAEELGSAPPEGERIDLGSITQKGGKVVRASRLMHGKVSPAHHDGKGLFAGMPQDFQAGRYHSLIAEAHSIPGVLEVTARTPEGEIMGVRHRSLGVEGVQFHPESVLTDEGKKLVANFLRG